MTPDRYADSSRQRNRLTGRTERRGVKTGLSTIGALAFGGVFVLAGAAIMLVGLKVIPVDPKGVHAPYWVLTMFGAVFALAGLMVWGMARTQFVSARRQREALRQHPDEPALIDYGWNPNGFIPSQWSQAAKTVGGAIFLTLFLSMFNWWAFFGKGPLMVKVIVSIFDLLAFFAWWQAFLKIGHAAKFGGSRLEFTQFPYRLGQSLRLRWLPASGISQVNQGTFTLRCVEEWFERRGHGKNSSTTLVHEEIWSGTWFLDQVRSFPRLEEMELCCELPADAPATQLSADKPIFWELEVKLDLPGLDFSETYLVPVYAGR